MNYLLTGSLRACGIASLAVLAVMSACSKGEKPGDTAKSESTTTANNAPALPANATPEQRIIAQARAAIGPEAKLEAINGLLMSGKTYDQNNNVLGSVVLLFQKPGSQHTELRQGNQTLIQASDGMIGWAMSVDQNNTRKLKVLPAEDEIQNVYSTMENLYFYRAAERVKGGEVHYEGDTDYRGVKCHKVSFNYPKGLSYVRYFDVTNGRLVGTVLLPVGTEVVETGALDVNGVIFPALLNTYSKEGKLLQVVKFDKINLNPTIDPSAKVFDLPNLVALAKSAATVSPAAAPASSTAQPGPTKPSSLPSGFPSADSLLKK